MRAHKAFFHLDKLDLGRDIVPTVITSVLLSFVLWLLLGKNGNFFKFFSHGVETRFSNFCLGHFVKVEAILSQNETSDEIDRVGNSDNSTPFSKNCCRRPVKGKGTDQ